ncbi:hypothetical protein QWY85_08495 [Neolewinella lacunae]|uniref:Uncharacterized protein n=1 Tax=Neolewinella lacunae TaxID=1517758 RepID=A0A923PMN9_9BACT|nr:hypothetical protein [Neolewinella lacunae]MBC6994023.1 hypothetical protein [Neolewinella lacunae]MDN3634693.1 hypothetical protein [Neolewinella lacunae]
MATFDPFESEFRRRATGLRRTPSAQAWNRLEHRLDQRGGLRIFGIRPWMVAALLLLVAGASIVTSVATDRNNPLAQRSQFIEELNTPYVPEESFNPADYRNELPDGQVDSPSATPLEYRDIVVSAKYRINS